jgi:hypothetical protein
VAKFGFFHIQFGQSEYPLFAFLTDSTGLFLIFFKYFVRAAYQWGNLMKSRLADDWIPTRQSLLSRLRDWDDQASWQDFFDTYWRLIYNVARRSGLTEVESQEVVQETIINVARQMPSFRYNPKKGSFKGWLLHTTQWRVGDQFRRRKGHVPIAGESEASPMTIDLSSDWDKFWDENLLETAVARV